MSDFIEKRRQSFDAAAQLYDDVRPGYPDQMVDAVLAYSKLPVGARALEIGAGTGQATAQFASRGLAVHAVEPGAAMADLIRHKLGGADLNVTVETADLEVAGLEPDALELVYASTSWHWLTPGVRWAIVAQTLKPGGTLAAFWNIAHWRRTALCPQLDVVYKQSGADLTQLGPMAKAEVEHGALMAEWANDAPNREAFTGYHGDQFDWSATYTAADYVSLLGTYGDHLALDRDVRERLFARIIELIEHSGGTIELPYSTHLLLARASRPALSP
jgi:SAM-dependent methyltransferase